MRILCLPLGDYQTNCYLVAGESSPTCVVIDPGYRPEDVLQAARNWGRSIEAILLTHGHFDHVGGVEAIVKETDCRLWMAEGDYTPVKNPENDFFYPIHDCDFTEVQFCEDQEQITAGGLTFTVYATPGHTHGSVCYRCEDALFSGDTLFAGSCGRTDLPGGSTAQIRASLKRLAALPEDLRVFPGHGEETTLSQERQFNPFMG